MDISSINFKTILKWIINDTNGLYFFNLIFDAIKKDYIIHDTNYDIYKLWDSIHLFVEKYEFIPDYAKLKNYLIYNSKFEDDKIDSILDEINNEDISIFQENTNHEFIIDLLEKFVINIATFSTLKDAVTKYSNVKNENSNIRFSINEIYKKFEKITEIAFEPNIGLDYNKISLYDSMHDKTLKIPSGIETINKYTNGGYEFKTLNIIMGKPGFGKTLFMISELCNILKTTDYKIMYISLEIAEIKILQRIIWNLSGKSFRDLHAMNKRDVNEILKNTIETYNIKERLIIKEFPTRTLTMQGLRAYYNKVIKTGFIPKVMFIDYMSIMKYDGTKGTYRGVGELSEDLRGFMVKNNLCGFSGMQANRGGQNSNVNNVEMDNMSDSVGVNAIVDFLAGGFINDVLKASNKVGLKFLKNRYDETKDYIIYPTVNFRLMRIYQNENESLEDQETVEERLYDKKPNKKKTVTIGDFVFN